MSRYDDDYDNHEDEHEEEEDGVSRSTSNPFSRPNSVRGAGLPQRPPNRPDGSVPSPLRSGGAGGGSSSHPNSPLSRPGSPTGGSSSSSNSSGVQPFQRAPLARPGSPDKKDDEHDRTAAVNRVLGSFNQKPGDPPADNRSDSRTPPNSTFGSGSRFGGDQRSDNRSSDNRNDSRHDSQNNSRDDKSGGVSGLTRGLGGNTSRISGGSGGGDTKKEDRPGGALGGLTSRFGGGGNDRSSASSAKSSSDKPGGALGGLTSRFGGGKKDDKPAGSKSGGALGGLGSRFGGGDANRGANRGAGSSEKSGGFASRFGGGGKKDDKPAGSKSGGLLGGLGSRFGGSKSGDQADSRSSGGLNNRLGDLSGGRTPSQSQSSGVFGSAGRQSSVPGASTPASRSGSSSPFGSSDRGGARSTGSKASGQSLGDRLKGLNPFGQKQETRSTRARNSRAPKVDQGGLSLDSKLDIIGVTLVLGSLVLLLSSLSPTKGALTESFNGALSYLFGWGAVFVLGLLFASGVWLILRHFGDEAPTISRTRMIGLGLLFVSALVLAQFIDAMQYQVGSGQDYLGTLKNVFLPIAYNLGRGGGWLGGQIYFVLLSNFGEIGGFLVVFIPVLVGLMLALNVSASDLAMIVISNSRNLGDVMGKRRQRAAALRAEKQHALVSATQSINISRPAEALTAGDSPALPAPVGAAASAASATDLSRRIPITTAGRTSNVPFRSPELVEVEAQANGRATAPAGASAPAAQQKSSGGLFGGIGARVIGALPLGGSSSGDSNPKPAKTDQSVPASAAEPAERSGLRGRFFGGKTETPAATTPQPATAQAVTPAMPTAASVAPESLRQPQTSAAPSAEPTVQQPAAATPRLGDLLRRQTTPAGSPDQPQQPTPAPVSNGNGSGDPNRVSGGVQPFQRSPLSRPPTPGAPVNPNAPANGSEGQKPPDRSLFGRPTPLTPLTTTPADAPAQQPAAQQNQPATDEPIPDLQTRLRALQQAQPASQAPTAQPPAASQPPRRMDPSVPTSTPRQTVSSAFGKPSDPPFAVTPRAPSADASTPPALPSAPRRPPRNWKMPDSAGVLASGIDQEPDHDLLLKRAHIIEETLLSFGAPGRVVDVRTGPVVTQFGVEPDYVPGRGGKKNRVKVGAIAALDKDLQLALGAKSIRIEAPVPGKGYVGIEVPNEKAEIVRLRDVLEAAEFKKVKSPLAIALGQGVDGTPVAADLASMPHLLIAGTTGSGKSVCVNAIIASLLLNNPPNRVKFVMVDPKRVELTQYNGIPHLIAPVVVELERIVSVLKWVTREMDERYRRFSNAAARNIEDFNKHLPANEDPMHYIVVIIDELADLMMLAPDDTERVITRIAALARATGIHLVIATQRPSVDVVTGLIKANFPARIAFAVAGNTDSRVILDQPGAERLLGRGDMLWMSGDSPAPVRLQGVYVSDTEIGNITHYWRDQMTDQDVIAASRPIGGSLSSDETRGADAVRFRSSSAPVRTPQSALWDQDDDDDDYADDALDDGDDDMYEPAVDLVRRLNKASVSLLQRRLRIGYTRAARLIDTMEERGIVGPATEGSKPREVLPVR